jgi:P4 family phage/plasmid primase-like protien
MEKAKYDMLLEELWDIMQSEFDGKDIEVAVKIRSQYERIGTITEILRTAAEKSSLSRWNGGLWCFTGQIYEQVTWRDVKNVIYDLMKRMKCPMSDFIRKDAIVRDVIDALEKSPLEVRNEIVVFENCVLDTDTMETHEHSKEFVQVTKLDYDYNPEATTFMWYQFLNEVLPDKTRQMVLQMFLGAVFIDRSLAKIESMLILLGSGSNGKSVVFETVMGVLGHDNVSNFGLGALMSGTDRKMNIATMNGKRLNYCSEIQLKEFGAGSDSLKAIISGEPIEARRIYGGNFTARNIPLLMANANQLPYLKDMSHGMARRLCVLSFDVEIPKEKQNRSLARDLRDEYPAIFNWIMEGRKQFVANNYKLPVLHDLEDAVEDYKSEYSTPLKFMMDNGWKRQADPNLTDITPRWMSLSSLYERYLRWCTANHVDDVLTKVVFSRTLRTAGWRHKNTNYGVEFGCYGKVTLTDLQMQGDKAQKMREKMMIEKIFRAEGRDYAQGRIAAAKACGVGQSIITRLCDQGKLTHAISYVEERPLYDIALVLDVLRKEGYFLDTREKHLQAATQAELKYMRGMFNSAMKYHELPFRKYKKTNVPRLDGSIRVDDTMTIEEARAKAAAGDFSGADDFNKSEDSGLSYLTEGMDNNNSNE